MRAARAQAHHTPLRTPLRTLPRSPPPLVLPAAMGAPPHDEPWVMSEALARRTSRPANIASHQAPVAQLPALPPHAVGDSTREE